MRSFAFRLLVLVLLLVGLQYIVSVLNPPEIPQDVLRLDRYLAAGVDILYFGDSTVGYLDDELLTAEVLQEMLPEHAVGEIAHPAYGLDVYQYYAKYLVRSDHMPDTVIIPINMRSFSPGWDLRPEYQFEREKTVLTYGLFLSRMLLRPFEIFGGLISDTSQAEFLDTIVFSGKEPVGRVRDYENLFGYTPLEVQKGELEFAYQDVLPSEDDVQALQKVLTYYYMYGLDSDHRKIESMLSVVDVLGEHGINPVFYITPINYQQGHLLLGDVFQERITENIELIKSLLLAKSTEVLDLTFDLEAYAFVDMEHLREIGKTHVAEQLSWVLKPELLASSGDSDPAPPTFVLPELSPAATATSSATVPTQPTIDGSSGLGTPEPPSDSGQVIGIPSPTVTPTLLSPASSDGVGASGVISDVRHLVHFEPVGNYPVDLYRLSYQSLDEDDQPVEIQANLFVPSVSGATSFPVLVYGPGTTGIGDMCAPLEEQVRGRDWGNYLGHMLEYAAQGYIGILPNGHGFDDPDRTHTYFIAELEARVLLDAARAAYRFFDHELSNDLMARAEQAIFIGGYSSGGHAAFAAKDYAATTLQNCPSKASSDMGRPLTWRHSCARIRFSARTLSLPIENSTAPISSTRPISWRPIGCCRWRLTSPLTVLMTSLTCTATARATCISPSSLMP